MGLFIMGSPLSSPDQGSDGVEIVGENTDLPRARVISCKAHAILLHRASLRPVCNCVSSTRFRFVRAFFSSE